MSNMGIYNYIASPNLVCRKHSRVSLLLFVITYMYMYTNVHGTIPKSSPTIKC